MKKNRDLIALVTGDPEKSGKLKMITVGSYGVKKYLRSSGKSADAAYLDHDLLKQIARTRNAEQSVIKTGEKDFAGKTIPVFGPGKEHKGV